MLSTWFLAWGLTAHKNTKYKVLFVSFRRYQQRSGIVCLREIFEQEWNGSRVAALYQQVGRAKRRVTRAQRRRIVLN